MMRLTTATDIVAGLGLMMETLCSLVSKHLNFSALQQKFRIIQVKLAFYIFIAYLNQGEELS